MLFFIAVLCGLARDGQYKNFRVAVYIPAGVVERMKDPQWLWRFAVWNGADC